MIKGKSINLRTIRQEDLDEIFTLTSDISQRGKFWDVRLTTEFSFKKRCQENGLWNDEFGTLVITDKEGKLLGDITYFKGLWYMPGYEVGYRIYRDEDKGKGYTSEALRIFSSYLFEVKPIERLEIECGVGNTASRRVAEKCGYKYEGTKRHAVFSRGKYSDIELFALLREECPPLNEVIDIE